MSTAPEYGRARTRRVRAYRSAASAASATPLPAITVHSLIVALRTSNDISRGYEHGDSPGRFQRPCRDSCGIRSGGIGARRSRRVGRIVLGEVSDDAFLGAPGRTARDSVSSASSGSSRATAAAVPRCCVIEFRRVAGDAVAAHQLPVAGHLEPRDGIDRRFLPSRCGSGLLRTGSCLSRSDSARATRQAPGRIRRPARRCDGRRC